MLTEIDIKRLPSYELGYEGVQACGNEHGEVLGQVDEKRVFVRQLLNRLDIEQVAALLELSTDEVKLIIADGDEKVSRGD